MTPQEALSVIDQAVALSPLNRQSHELVIKALGIIQETIKTNGRQDAKERGVREDKTPA